jgi:hypothetical protein
VDALRITENDVSKGNIALVMSDLSKSGEGRAALISAGACGALVDALRVTERQIMRYNVVQSIGHFSMVDEVILKAVSDALKSAGSDNAKAQFSHAISILFSMTKGDVLSSKRTLAKLLHML